MAEIKADEFVDITDVNCPVTFVKAKVAIEEIDLGQVLQIHLNDGEPVQNVPRSLKDEGHKVLKLEDNGDETFELYVEKGAE
ncbi:MAG: sulfurtransferase TusA family protein [Firmicutes bacterium]|nr:sulfurtransferase TusA family protein [Bacillota bacterium]